MRAKKKQSMNRFKSLTVKFFLYFVLIAALPILAFVFFVIPQAEEFIKDEAVREYAAQIDERVTVLNGYYEQHRTQAASLSSLPPVQGIIRSRSTGKDPVDGSTYVQWRSRFEAIFLSILAADPEVLQLRYIDEYGDELVRVNNTAEGPYVVPSDELQNKASRAYFIEGMNTREGEVYVTDIELNVEQGVIEIPHVPTVRFVVPVFSDDTKERKGILIINVNAKPLLFDRLSLTRGDYLLVNGAGDIVMHPDEELRFGKQLGGPSFNQYAPRVGSYINTQQVGGEFELDDTIFFWKQVYYGEVIDRDFLLYVAEIEIDELYALVARFRNTLWPFMIVLAAILLFGAMILGRIVTRPIAELQEAAQGVAEDNFDVRFNDSLIQRTDEIGVLAQSLVTMVGKLKIMYGTLERQVSEKTRELQESLAKASEQNEDLGHTRTAMLNVLEDIAEERDRAERQKTRLDLALSAATIGTWEWEVVTGELSWDENMFALYGIAKSDFTGRYESFQRLVHPDDVEQVEKELQDAVTGKKDFDTQFRIVTPDKKEKVVRARARIVFDEKQKAQRAIGVNWDITHEAEIDRAKTEFVSLASHQLRTPLSSMNWFAEMLMDGDAGKLNKKQQEFIGEIYAGSKRMTDLVSSLLNVSRIELGTFAITTEEVLLADIVTDVETELAYRIRDRKQTFTKKIPKMVPIALDRKLTHMIIENLLSNAVKYTPEGGTINLTVQRKQDGIYILVKDSGVGIPKTQQDRVFQKLFRADNVVGSDTQGTGLGLYIVKSVVEAAGGKISFVSKENKGTTFTVVLPKEGMIAKKGSRSLDDMNT